MKRNACLTSVRLVLLFVFACHGATFARAQAKTESGGLPDAMQIDLGGGVEMDFVLIHPGSFTMGSNSGKEDEKPVHQVTISQPFYMGKYEVTQEQWQKVMGKNPSSNKAKRSRFPVEQVSWIDCTNFTAKLADKMPGRQFTLPTEAQWEYACRAGSDSAFCYGDDVERLDQYAWYHHTRNPISVGSSKPNAWGLYDMHGNVWEWCLDLYHANYVGAPIDGSAWTQIQANAAAGRSSLNNPKTRYTALYHVQRGGSYASFSSSVRSAYRGKDTASVRNSHYGLRVVLTVGTP